MPNASRALPGGRAAVGLLVLLSAVPAHAVERALPAQVSVLTRDDFANREWFTVADVLDQTPGLDVLRTGYRNTEATARLRGISSPDALVVAIDGRPISHEFDGAVDVSKIPLNMVDRIEITRGGSSVVYGPAAAGVVNIVTTRPIREGLTVDLGHAVGRDGVRQSDGRFQSRARWGDAVYIAGISDSGGFSSNDAADGTSHFANYTRSFRHGGYLGGEYFYNSVHEGTPDGTAVPFDLWNGHAEQVALNPDGFQRQIYQMARVTGATPEIGGGILRLDLTQGWRNRDSAPTEDSQILSDDAAASEAKLVYTRNGLNLGGEAGTRRRAMEDLPHQSEDRSAGFASKRIEAGRFAFQPEVRWDRHSRGGAAATLRGVVLYEPADGWMTSITAQSAPRFADFDQIYDATGTARDLKPERADSVDAGVVWSTKRFRLGATGFETAARDVIAPSSDGFFRNDARERTTGVETEASARVGRGVWSELHMRGSWTLQDARRRDAGAADYADAPLAPRTMAFAAADYTIPWKGTLTNEVRYKGVQYAGTGRTGAKLPPFALWNVRLSFRIHTADVFFAGENLLGRRYAESVGSTGALEPQPTRTFWAGVTIRFID